MSSQIFAFASRIERRVKVAIEVFVDFILVVLSVCLAVYLRLESFDLFVNPLIWYSTFLAGSVFVFSLWCFGFYKILLRYLTGRILKEIFISSLMSAGSLYVFVLMNGSNMPRSIPFIYIGILVLGVAGVRYVVRSLFRNARNVVKESVLIYGAGESGQQLLHSLSNIGDYRPIAFIDDDESLHSYSVGGLQVYSSNDLPRIMQSTRADLVLLAIPSLGRRRRREIVQSCQDLGVPIKTIPGMSELISGDAKLSDLREISPEDLLGRELVPPIERFLGKCITDKVVLVTGAGGSIGSELCRQILPQVPSVLILFECSEYALYSIDAELKSLAVSSKSPSRVVSILGSVQDEYRFKSVVDNFKVDTIYHAAAFKHVPIVEDNIIEAIRNNVFGTNIVARVASDSGVKNAILISTDKAVRPTNVMGATKRLAELLFQAYAESSDTTVFSMVRFGNVLGSSGSVIPLFKRQIENGGPITVTDIEVIRYFMTIPEAALLVIQAGAMAKGGDVFVLDMGDPIKILDLALTMVRLQGLRPYVLGALDGRESEDGDIAIHVTGLRKGEKLYEELLVGNDPLPTEHPRIMTAKENHLSLAAMLDVISQLETNVYDGDVPSILKRLRELPIDYNPADHTCSDVVWSTRSA